MGQGLWQEGGEDKAAPHGQRWGVPAAGVGLFGGDAVSVLGYPPAAELVQVNPSSSMCIKSPSSPSVTIC